MIGDRNTMASTTPDLSRVELHLPPEVKLDDDLFFAICQANRDYRIERSAEGDIQIMPPTGGDTGKRNSDLIIDLGNWARDDGRGVVFDSSTGFRLPNGATRSPDVSWVLRERLARLTDKQKQGFLPLAPDLIIELASPNDRLEDLQMKMREYQENGVRLGWLIVPTTRTVYVYPQGTEPQCLTSPSHLADNAMLPGLFLDLTKIWEPAF